MHAALREYQKLSIVFCSAQAKEDGDQNITVRFYQQQTYVGQIEIDTEIIQPNKEVHAKSPVTSESKDWTLDVLPEKTLSGPDITIYIQERRISPDFEYGVLISSSEYAIKEMGPNNFPFNPETKFQKIFQDIEDMNMDADIVDQKIKSKGMTLYEELFPAKLKDLYWEKIDRIKSDMITNIDQEQMNKWVKERDFVAIKSELLKVINTHTKKPVEHIYFDSFLYQ